MKQNQQLELSASILNRKIDHLKSIENDFDILAKNIGADVDQLKNVVTETKIVNAAIKVSSEWQNYFVEVEVIT